VHLKLESKDLIEIEIPLIMELTITALSFFENELKFKLQLLDSK
jgi:hypothetical protein